MKKLKFWSMIVLAVMVIPTMVACGGDDDGGGVTPPTGKRLVKMTEVGEKNTYVFEYSYDSQGRVVRIDRKKNDVSDQSTTYAYTDNKIVKKTTYAAGDMRQTEYMLENGFIVSEKHQQESDNVQYTYANNRIATRTNSNNTYNYTWSGGNLMSIEHSGKTETYEYTSIIAPQCPFNFMELDDPLAPYFGLTTKNLPSKVVYKNDEILYDWTMEGGLPVKMVMTETDSRDTDISIITFEWK
jgi:hypothetical protein